LGDIMRRRNSVVAALVFVVLLAVGVPVSADVQSSLSGKLGTTRVTPRPYNPFDDSLDGVVLSTPGLNAKLGSKSQGNFFFRVISDAHTTNDMVNGQPVANNEIKATNATIQLSPQPLSPTAISHGIPANTFALRSNGQPGLLPNAHPVDLFLHLLLNLTNTFGKDAQPNATVTTTLDIRSFAFNTTHQLGKYHKTFMDKVPAHNKNGTVDARSISVDVPILNVSKADVDSANHLNLFFNVTLDQTASKKAKGDAKLNIVDNPVRYQTTTQSISNKNIVPTVLPLTPEPGTVLMFALGGAMIAVVVCNQLKKSPDSMS